MAFTERALIACSASILAFITFYYYWHSKKRTKSKKSSQTTIVTNSGNNLIESKENGIGCAVDGGADCIDADSVGDCCSSVAHNNQIEPKHCLNSNGNKQTEIQLKVWKKLNHFQEKTAINCSNNNNNTIENHFNQSLTSEQNNQCAKTLNKVNNDTGLKIVFF